MKKYKLIKTYPGFCKLGTIGWEDKTQCNFKYPNTDKLSFSSDLISFELYPEFWKEVIKKDYEILSFYSDSHFKNKISIDEKQLDNTFRRRGYSYSAGLEDHYFLESSIRNGWKIYSVKRLSDGEVFTIGDRIVNQYNYNAIIKQINIVSSSIDFNWFNGLKETHSTTLKDVEKAKQKLFTTEDGVDIFEGDIFCLIRTPSYTNLCELKASSISSGSNEYQKVFSTKEKAEEYVLMNKPCLSFNDMFKFLNNHNYISVQSDVEDLRILAQSKIK